MIDILIPCKGFAAGKSRLAPVLSAEARAHFCRALLEHTVATALVVAGPRGRVAVVSCDTEVLRVAKLAGGMAHADPNQGLNSALDFGNRRLGPGTPLIVLPIDLPQADASQIAALVEWGKGIAIAPDREGTGTNVLALGPAARAGFPFAFGEGSFVRHLKIAAELELSIRTVRDPALELDIDRPVDLAALSGGGGSGEPISQDHGGRQ